MLAQVDGVAEELEVVGGEHLPEGAVDVEGEVSDAACGLAEVEAGDVGFGGARVDLLHGEVGVAGDESDGGFGEVLAWGDVEAGDSVDDARGVFEAGEDDVAREGFVLEAEVGVEHGAGWAAGEVDGEEIGESEVLAWGA